MAGFALQTTVLWALASLAGWPALAATALAVESALLCNFALHERWTWRDRPARLAVRLGRLWRFHLLNGSVSMAGNLAVVAVLTGGLDVPVLVANTAAVALCSLVNFAGSEHLVFRPGGGSLEAGPTPAR